MRPLIWMCAISIAMLSALSKTLSGAFRSVSWKKEQQCLRLLAVWGQLQWPFPASASRRQHAQDSHEVGAEDAGNVKVPTPAEVQAEGKRDNCDNYNEQIIEGMIVCKALYLLRGLRWTIELVPVPLTRRIIKFVQLT